MKFSLFLQKLCCDCFSKRIREKESEVNLSRSAGNFKDFTIRTPLPEMLPFAGFPELIRPSAFQRKKRIPQQYRNPKNYKLDKNIKNFQKSLALETILEKEEA